MPSISLLSLIALRSLSLSLSQALPLFLFHIGVQLVGEAHPVHLVLADDQGQLPAALELTLPLPSPHLENHCLCRRSRRRGRASFASILKEFYEK
ncbi:hypothetical protein RchiOBHm_Chr6g0277011 [Rosa chinensis]|uniref:Secreted protein n=1 Tax=Rosa chinensis TaxID=74649 RepID=A0A2P6PSE7_ROSCH|nr:hypothetical protein RchiOBHm_Chr6g0277011 [Rosa chinensis]